MNEVTYTYKISNMHYIKPNNENQSSKTRLEKYDSGKCQGEALLKAL